MYTPKPWPGVYGEGVMNWCTWDKSTSTTCTPPTNLHMTSWITLTGLRKVNGVHTCMFRTRRMYTMYASQNLTKMVRAMYMLLAYIMYMCGPNPCVHHVHLTNCAHDGQGYISARCMYTFCDWKDATPHVHYVHLTLMRWPNSPCTRCTPCTPCTRPKSDPVGGVL